MEKTNINLKTCNVDLFVIRLRGVYESRDEQFIYSRGGEPAVQEESVINLRAGKDIKRSVVSVVKIPLSL